MSGSLPWNSNISKPSVYVGHAYKIISRTTRIPSYITNGNKKVAFQKEVVLNDKQTVRNISKMKNCTPPKKIEAVE